MADRTFKTTSHQILDGYGNPTPLMLAGTAQKVTTSGTTARSAAISEGATIRVYCTEDFYYKTGDVTVEAAATDHFHPASTILDVPLGKGNTHIALIQVSAGATAYITEYL